MGVTSCDNVLLEPIEPVDPSIEDDSQAKITLQASHDEANELLTNTSTGTSPGDVDDMSWFLLKAKVSRAKEILDDSQSTDDDYETYNIILQAAIATFQDAIIPETPQQDLQTLNENLQRLCDEADILLTNTEIGEDAGEISQEKWDNLETGRNLAMMVLSYESSEETITNYITNLTTLIDDFKNAIVPGGESLADQYKAILTTTYIVASNLLDTTSIGNEVGSIPENEWYNLETARNNAALYLSGTSYTVMDYYEQNILLNTAIDRFNGSIITESGQGDPLAAEKTALNIAIATAWDLISTTPVGTETGSVPQSAIDDLSLSLNAAVTLLQDSEATAEQLVIENQKLSIAIALFNSQVIE
jgi:hypothetical protein